MECKAYVPGGGAVAHKCRLDEGHAGPCATPDIPRSTSARARWIESEEAKNALAQFQGRPQTTAERYTDGATPVPGKTESIDEHPGTVATRPGLRTGVEVMRMALSCAPCRNGRHEVCDMIVMNEGAVDAKDFINSGCACFEANPEAHEREVETTLVIDDDGTEWVREEQGDREETPLQDAEFVYGFLAAAYGESAPVTVRSRRLLECTRNLVEGIEG